MKRLNQILSVENNQKQKGKSKKNKNSYSGPIEIQNILKFFAISILIFGIFMIGSGSYSMYKQGTKKAIDTQPVIYVNQTSETEIRLKITHDKELAKVTYRWNEEGETQVPCSRQQEVETIIEIPTGTNTLKVQATDINGKEIQHKEIIKVC